MDHANKNHVLTFDGRTHTSEKCMIKPNNCMALCRSNCVTTMTLAKLTDFALPSFAKPCAHHYPNPSLTNLWDLEIPADPISSKTNFKDSRPTPDHSLLVGFPRGTGWR